jgi:hypothetical protein
MGETPKFKTFRDLRNLSPGNTSISSSTSISSRTKNFDENIKEASAETETLPGKKTSKPKLKAKSSVNKTRSTTSVSPEKDFQKVPNSITRFALPDKFFRGKSKQVWDYLWSVSRGAISPSRTVNATRGEIKDKAGLGSMVTVDASIEHLQKVGLINVSKVSVGSSRGNEYEVFSPEEAQERYSSISSISSYTSLTQKVDILDILESGISSITQTIENKETYEPTNTSLKTNTNDDEKKAFARFEKLFESVSVELTGRGLQKNEKGKWKDLAELLIMELKVAALRTDSISSVPAFLTEHLRRRLWQNDEKQPKSQNRSYNKDVVGKSDSDSGALEVVSGGFTSQDQYIPESLTEKQRETVLASMEEFLKQGKTNFVMSLKNTYAEEDWNWLMKEIKTNNR